MSIAASHVISDQTELRLLEQSPRRTDILMHKWGCRNGTVGELVQILEGLQWFRPRDIILGCMHAFYFLCHCILSFACFCCLYHIWCSDQPGYQVGIVVVLWNSVDHFYSGTFLTSNISVVENKQAQCNISDISLLWSHMHICVSFCSLITRDQITYNQLHSPLAWGGREVGLGATN